MKRLRIALMAIAITVSISGAFASSHQNPGCALTPQYYKFVAWYLPAGTFGLNYVCIDIAGVCTYYRPDPFGQPNYYVPCRLGVYFSLF